MVLELDREELRWPGEACLQCEVPASKDKRELHILTEFQKMFTSFEKTIAIRCHLSIGL